MSVETISPFTLFGFAFVDAKKLDGHAVLVKLVAYVDFLPTGSHLGYDGHSCRQKMSRSSVASFTNET